MDVEEDFLEKFPFLSVLELGTNGEIIGIIQNQTQTVTSVYVYEKVDEMDKQEFLALADEWWWESNRIIPINLVLGNRFHKFHYALKTFNSKNAKISRGPTVSLNSINEKRIKRRQIQLCAKNF